MIRWPALDAYIDSGRNSVDKGDRRERVERVGLGVERDSDCKEDVTKSDDAPTILNGFDSRQEGDWDETFRRWVANSIDEERKRETSEIMFGLG